MDAGGGGGLLCPDSGSSLLTAGSALLAVLGAVMERRISWFAFHWPAGPAALMTAGLFVICLGVPFLACRRGSLSR